MQGSLHPLFRFFPAPAYLTMPAVGLDMSDESIKLADLHKDKSEIRLRGYADAKIAAGVIEGGVIKQPEKLAAHLKSLREQYRFEWAHISLPTEHVYLFQTEIPKGTPFNQIATLIEFKLKENVPLAPEDSVLDFQFVPFTTNASSTIAAVAVYPQEIARTYLEVFQEAGIKPLSFETEGGANARAIVPSGKCETIMIIDIGRSYTELSIIHNGIIASTTTLEVSGDDFTETIARFMQIPKEKAEMTKREKGFLKNKENNELFEALLGSVSVLRDEITKQHTYWQLHTGVDRGAAKGVEKIVLCGGGSNLKGLQQYLEVTMNMPVEHANVWVNISSFDQYIPPMEKEKSLIFTTALGLALRSIQRTTTFL